MTPADLVFANILKGPLVDLAPEMARRVAPGGHAILSGLLTDQGAGVAELYSRHGFNQVHRDDIGDWTCLTLRRLPPKGG